MRMRMVVRCIAIYRIRKGFRGIADRRRRYASSGTAIIAKEHNAYASLDRVRVPCAVSDITHIWPAAYPFLAGTCISGTARQCARRATNDRWQKRPSEEEGGGGKNGDKCASKANS